MGYLLEIAILLGYGWELGMLLGGMIVLFR